MRWVEKGLNKWRGGKSQRKEEEREKG